MKTTIVRDIKDDVGSKAMYTLAIIDDDQRQARLSVTGEEGKYINNIEIHVSVNDHQGVEFLYNLLTDVLDDLQRELDLSEGGFPF